MSDTKLVSAFIFIFSMITFIIVILFVIIHPTIKLPRVNKKIKLDYGFIPLCGVLLLFLKFQVHPSTFFVGIIGSDTIKPYSILILFMSLVYICISIDKTGVFSFVALHAVKKSKSSSKRLFIYFFFLSSLLTTFTSNDIVILTLTPIILYFAKYTKTNPIPYLFCHFFASQS